MTRKYTYIGPMIKIADDLTEEYIKEQTSCSNIECANYHKEIKGNFCSSCGWETREYGRKAKRDKNLFTYDGLVDLEDVEDVAFPPGNNSNILISDKCLHRTDHTLYQPLSEINLDEQFDYFEKETRELVTCLKLYFGDENVKVENAICVFLW